MNKEVIYDNLMKDYELRRLRNVDLIDARKVEVFKKCPEIKKYSDDIVTAATSYARNRLRGMSDADAIAKKNEAIHNATNGIQLTLLRNGYPVDYLDIPYTCDRCLDTCFIGNEPCDCLKRAYREYNYEASGIKKIIEKENFKTINMKYYSKEVIPAHGMSPYENMMNIGHKLLSITKEFDQAKPGILMYGETGLGKSFFSHAVAKELLDLDYTVYYVTAVDLFDNIISPAITSRYASDDVKKTYKNLFDVDMLIIDDLGTEVTTAFTNTHLFQLLADRILAEKSTFISTNLNLSDINTRYSERILSRIVESFEIMHVYGENIRLMKK